MMVVHLYNEFWRRSKIDKNNVDYKTGTLFDFFVRKYINLEFSLAT